MSKRKKAEAVDARVLDATLAAVRLILPDFRGWHYRVAKEIAKGMGAKGAPAEGSPERALWFKAIDEVKREDGAVFSAENLYRTYKKFPAEAKWFEVPLSKLVAMAIRPAARTKKAPQTATPDGTPVTDRQGEPGPGSMTRDQMLRRIGELEQELRALREKNVALHEANEALKQANEALRWRLEHTPAARAN